MSESPAYEYLAYRQQIAVWRSLDDVFNGAESWLGRDANGCIHITKKTLTYLPREAAEEDRDYLNRLGRSPFEDRFAQSLRKFVALVLANGVEKVDVPPVMLPQFEDVDLEGGHLHQVISEVAIASLRHGHTFVLVDYPPQDETVKSQADLLRSNRRPYWVHYPATEVIHWRRDGRNLVQVTLRERAIVPVGRFGEKEVTRYRVLGVGWWEVWEPIENTSPREFRLVGSGQTSLNFIPLVCLYGGLRQGHFRSRPPLKALADLNLTHYQVKSDHLRKIHLCCLPVPELKDSMRPEGEELKIGPNSLVHIRDRQGSFNWKEPLATSIEQSRKEVNDLQEAMDVLSAAYLNQPGDRQTATTSAIQTVELESNLEMFVSQFGQGLREVLRCHAAYLGISDGGNLKLSGDILRDKGRDSQMLLAYSVMGDRRQISQRSLLQLLKEQEFLPDDFDVEAETGILNRDGSLLRELLQLTQLDMLSKRQSLQLLAAHDYLPNDFDIEAAIQATGEQMRISAAGYLKTQPTPEDEFIPPSHVEVSQDGNT